jgi:transcriptional regulator with XRE-family HTH domain
MSETRFSDQIRQAVDDSGLSRYAICKLLDFDQGAFSKFMNGKGGLSMEVLDRLAEHLGLSVVVRAKGRTKKKGD